MSYSIGKVGYVRVHPLGGNDYPSMIPPAAYGCGDADAVDAYGGRQMAREREQERMERFCPHDASLPADWKPGTEPYPWQVERAERMAIAGELMEQGLRGTELDGAIDLTVFARRFMRWAEDGFPFNEKGTT